MAAKTEYYKGQRKKRNRITIPIIIILSIIALIMVIFFGMQKFAVITKDGVSVEVPILSTTKTEIDESGHVVRVFDEVDAALTFDPPDYSGVEQQASGRVDPIRAIFVSSEELGRETVMGYASRLNSGNALVLEMKPASGLLMWNSSASAALNYGIYQETPVTAALPNIIHELKTGEKKIWLAAQISCCIDQALPARSTTVALKNGFGGNYSDDSGTWLDPYNMQVRNYVTTMIEELYDMGFDEVILANVMHPVITDPEMILSYTKEMSTPPSPENAVCGMALSIANSFAKRDKVLSIYVNTPVALVRTDTQTGQNGPLFMKLFDRVYYSTDKYTYSYNVEDMEPSVARGNVYDRFVPVVVNYLPDTSSWVLIDTTTE